MASLEQLAVSATAQSLLESRHTDHLLQLRSWRSPRGSPLPHALRARILDALAFAFDLEHRARGTTRHGELAFWMETLDQLILTAPWALQPVGLRVSQLPSPLNHRVLRNLCPGNTLVQLHVDGPAVCDELMRTVSKLPALVSATFECSAQPEALSIAGFHALADCSALAHLALKGCKITDTGAVALRRLTTLVTLDLSRNTMSDTGVKELMNTRHGAFPRALDLGLSHVQCMLLLDSKGLSWRGVSDFVSSLQPGARVFWSRAGGYRSEKATCFTTAFVAGMAPQVESVDPAAAHDAIDNAADATHRARPAIEFSVQVAPGKGKSFAVSALPGQGDAHPTVDAQSRRSVSRMLRLLCVPQRADAVNHGTTSRMWESFDHGGSAVLTRVLASSDSVSHPSD